MVSAGSPADPTFSSTWVFSRACSAGWSWRSSPPLIAPEHYSSSASTLRWQMGEPSRLIWRRCATASGWFTANDPSEDPRKFCATSPANPPCRHLQLRRLPLGGRGQTCRLPGRTAWPVRLVPGRSQRSSKHGCRTGTAASHRRSIRRCRRPGEPDRLRHREHSPVTAAALDRRRLMRPRKEGRLPLRSGIARDHGQRRHGFVTTLKPKTIALRANLSQGQP